MELKELIKKLRDLGVSEATADYDGGGDSGEVNGVGAKDAKGKDVELPEDIPEPLRNAATKYLDSNGIDWYNNSGGYGTYTLDIEKGKQKLDHSERVESTEESSHEEDIDVLDMMEDADVAEEMAVCTCPSLISGHHAGCPYVKAKK
jgi:hypothetical protein